VPRPQQEQEGNHPVATDVLEKLVHYGRFYS